MTGWAYEAVTVADDQRQRSRQILETGQRFADDWVGSCDAVKAAGSGHGSGGDGVAAAAAAVGGAAAASAGAAAGGGDGSSVMR